jgi:ribosome recycling factor
MSTDPDTILLELEDHMSKAVDYLKKEFQGIRAGRASPSLVEYIKVDYYGSQTDLKAIAAVSVPEPTQLLIKPFDVGALSDIRKAIESSGLGLNPMTEGKTLRVNIPPLSRDRRAQLATQAKRLADEQKVVLRNARRDANKLADSLLKQPGKQYPEDEVDQLKKEIQDLLKKYEEQMDQANETKAAEIMEV